MFNTHRQYRRQDKQGRGDEPVGEDGPESDNRSGIFFAVLSICILK